MATLNVVKTLVGNPQDLFLEASKILLKFANNILENPRNPKYRKIRIANPIVMEKLLPVEGAMDCLFAMGFQEQEEDCDFLHFPLERSTEELRKVRDDIEKETSRVQGDGQVEYPASTANTQTPGRVEYPGHTASLSADSAAGIPAAERLVYPPHTERSVPTGPPQLTAQNLVQIFAKEMQFYQRISSEFQRVLVYEDQRLQTKALQCIPMNELRKAAEQRLKNINDMSEGAEVDAAIDAKDCFIIELAKWFRTRFFSWVDQPKCQRCDGATKGVGAVEPSSEDRRWGAGRVENYFCDRCQIHTRFPRYNSPEKLLETRRGRCGEWANCFTLLCRACGYEARHVVDWTDHVWTEVYSQSQQRWVHSDTGEDGYDKPLVYEAGWGKKLTYVIAYSRDDIQDVTWRYSAHHKEVLSRRTEVREMWLVDSLIKLRKERQSMLPEPRRKELDERAIIELIELLSERKDIKEGENVSRQTGSLAWRIARGEAGARAIASKPSSFIYKLTEKEKVEKTFHVKYCCASDKYVRVSKTGEETSGWNSQVFECKDVFRKEEADWKMAYLARSEKTDASISWKFDFTDTNLSVDQITIKAHSQTFETGRVSWRLCSENDCMMLNGGLSPVTSDHMKGAKSLTLTANMSQGSGDNAWQHTQLFRQGLDNLGEYPLDIKITFL